MEGFFWKTLLMVVALSASGYCAPSQTLLTYDEAVEQGVVIYNRKAEEDSLYRLLGAAPQPEWDPNSEGTQELKFSIKETVCPAAAEGGSLDKCNFKEGGVVRECTGNFFLGEKPPMAVLTCDAVEGMEEDDEAVEEKEEEEEENQGEEEEEEDQAERSRKLKKFFKKVEKGTKKVFKKVEKGTKKVLEKVVKLKIKEMLKRGLKKPLLDGNSPLRPQLG